MKRIWKLTTSSVAVGLGSPPGPPHASQSEPLSRARGSGRPQPLDERDEIVFTNSLADQEGR
jgi:hypothetical protein